MKTNQIINSNDLGVEELCLAPEIELYEEAEKIADRSVNDPKYLFSVKYDPNQKDFLMTVLTKLCGVVKEENEEGSILVLSVNMQQLQFLKTLDCVERVREVPLVSPELLALRNKRNMAETVNDTSNDVATFSMTSEAVETSGSGIATASVAEEQSAEEPQGRSFDDAIEVEVESSASGYICCPECCSVYYKFIASIDGIHTIYTTGDLDTAGYLYDADRNMIATNDDPPGRTNFRIAETLEAGKEYYVVVETRNSETGNFRLYITNEIFASSVSVEPTAATMLLGDTLQLSASVVPSNATDPGVFYYCYSNDVVTVDEETGLVTAVGVGTDTVYVFDKYERTMGTECRITVSVPVTSICLNAKRKTLGKNETFNLNVIFTPSNALSQGVVWSSSAPSVAVVEQNTGVVTAMSEGKTTITATYERDGLTDTCDVTVDYREKARVINDGDFFKIVFENGAVWKSIGYDLSLQENHATNDMWNRDYYDVLFDHEKRFLDNTEQSFSVEQIAYIYRFDPLGIEFYVKWYSNTYRNLTDGLFYKDKVYNAIFGESNEFYFTIIDENICYGNYTGWNRDDVFSNAEILFGFHNIFDSSSFMMKFLELLFSLNETVSTIQTGVALYQALFHSGSFAGLYGSGASGLAEEYALGPVGNIGDHKFREDSKKMVCWVTNLLSVLSDFGNAVLSSFICPNANDITLYKKIKEQTRYCTIYEYCGKEASMEDIINWCPALGD